MESALTCHTSQTSPVAHGVAGSCGLGQGAAAGPALRCGAVPADSSSHTGGDSAERSSSVSPGAQLPVVSTS